MKIPLYEETAWLHAKVNDKVKIEIETNQSYVAIDSSYACVVKAKHKYFDGWKTVGHVPRETSSYIYFLIKKGGRISGNMKSLNYKSLLIPPGDLYVPLLLTFSCLEKDDDDELFLWYG